MWNRIHVQAPFLHNSEINLNFYKPGKSREMLNAISIFGRNGSGKTTISNAISAFNKDSIADVDTVEQREMIEFKDVDKEEIERDVSSEINENIFVYNQNFIDEHVRISNNENLEAVVRLREQGKYQEQFDANKQKLNELIEEIKSKEEEIETLEDKNTENGPDYYYQCITENLKMTGNWASIASEINNTKTKKHVTRKEIDRLKGLKISFDKNDEELLKSLSEKVNQIKTIRSEKQLKSIKITLNPNNEVALKKILSKEVQKPNLDEYKQRILNKLNEEEIYPKKRLDIFTNKDTVYCPTCLRDISQDEKEHIVNASLDVIDMIKNDNYRKELKTFKLKTLSEFENESVYPVSIQKNIIVLNQKIAKYNEGVSEFKECIKKKFENIYWNVVFPEVSLNSLFSEVNETQKKLNQQIMEYNKRFSRLKELIEEANDLNDQFAALGLKRLFKEWKLAINNLNQCKEALEEKKLEKKKIEDELFKIKARMQGQEIALTEINQMLAMIFMDKTRLVLKEGENCYKVFSKGEPISLKNLSTGEQNAISLCYFFSTI